MPDTRVIGPRVHDKRIQLAFTVTAAVLGGVLLLLSHGRTDLTRDGLISGGMAALSFAGLILYVDFRPRDGPWEWLTGKFVNGFGFYAGIAAILAATQADNGWAQTFWLEAGIAILFLSAVEVAFDYLISEAETDEDYKRQRREYERQVREELLLRCAFAFDLSVWAYLEVQAALDEVTYSGPASAAYRTSVVLTYVRNASTLPPGADAGSDPEFRATMQRHVRAMDLAAAVAQRRKLSDCEFFDLFNEATIRSDPNDESYSEEIDRELPRWVQDAAAALIAERQSSGGDPEWLLAVNVMPERPFATPARQLMPQLDRKLLRKR